MACFLIAIMTAGRTNAVLRLAHMDARDARWLHASAALGALLWLTVHGFLTNAPAWAAGGYYFQFWVGGQCDRSGLCQPCWFLRP
jgi:hypothetical protein